MTDLTIRQLDQARSMAHGEQLARAARTQPDKVAYRFAGTDRSFAQLDERVNRLANALADRGVGYGDRVATLMTNRLEVIETYLASAKLGAICVPVNFRLVADEIAYILSDSGASALVVDASLAEMAGAARSQISQPQVCLVTGDDPTPAGAGAQAYEPVLAAASAAAPDVIVSEMDPAFIMYTSGTTGRPKGAVLSHFNLLMNTINMVTSMGINGTGEVWLSGLPLFHIGGLNGILPYLLLGGTTVMLPSGQFDANEVVDALEREQVTGCYFVPTQWQQICAVPGIADRKLALRRISWGASVAPPSVLRAMADTFPGVPNFNAFGQTEMSSVTCVLRGEDAVRKMGSVGTPVGNIEVRIVDADMEDVPDGEVGEIVYRGPTVMQGYWNKAEATAEAFEGGWFHSGDLVRRDEEGYIYVVDRKKDMIISGGENIYCAEVEAVIDAHPGVAEVALIGVPDPKWVETPRAVIVARDPEHPPTQDEIIAWCKERLASYKKPTSVVVLDALPRNASGKVLKTQLRNDYGLPR
ncbi:MAG: o-succinylbenzoate--CoA ligase [Acidimicrobiales bacterium]